MTTLTTTIKQRPALAHPIISAQSEKRESLSETVQKSGLIPAKFQVWKEENTQKITLGSDNESKITS